MSRLLTLAVALATGLVFVVSPAVASSFPESIPLPDGFYPEGLEVGAGDDFYVGSLLDGAIYKGDLRTGEGGILAEGDEGRTMAGLSFDGRSGLLWGIGGDTSGFKAFAFDGESGELIHEVLVPGGFPNDLVVTRQALYITDSFDPVLWTVSLTNRGAPAGDAVETELSGDFQLVTEGDPFPVNLNGIVATPRGDTLIAVHTVLGVLYRIDPTTGHATEIDLGGEDVPFGDGIVLQGRNLYVVQNFLNQVVVVELSAHFTTGEITETITSELFRVPTTGAMFGGNLYVVNARFDVAFPPVFGGDPMSIEYEVVEVPVT
jgi:hypothetical protein